MHEYNYLPSADRVDDQLHKNSIIIQSGPDYSAQPTSHKGSHPKQTTNKSIIRPLLHLFAITNLNSHHPTPTKPRSQALPTTLQQATPAQPRPGAHAAGY